MAFHTRKLNGSGSKHPARWGHREDVKAATKSRRRAEDKTVTVEFSDKDDPAALDAILELTTESIAKAMTDPVVEVLRQGARDDERKRTVAFMRKRIELWRRLTGIAATEESRRRWLLVMDQVALLADEIEDGRQDGE